MSPELTLIGQYDSPFVRRVAIALRCYDIPFTHRPWSVFGDADKLARYNPISRVPTLVIDENEALIESAAILDYLDELAGRGKALIADGGAARRHGLKLCALATGAAEKGVSLVYERVFHDDSSRIWIDRCRGQIAEAMDALEAERKAVTTPFWFGDAPGHGDIAVGCVLRFLGEAHPGLLDRERWPLLLAHSARCEELPAFKEIQQPFFVTMPKD